MERPAGPPLGAATQSSGWATDGSASTRQPPPNGDTMRKMPSLQRMPSDGSMFISNPTSTAQVVALVKQAMQNALEENQTKSGGTSGITNEMKPGITIDMSHKKIQRFPEEVVDIIKSELERLALSHNQISTFPSRFAECTSLRYLNVRNNAIREFPLAICELSSLEILDMGRNDLRILPPELAKLTALKVLSVPNNHIEELPLCLADMNSLQCLKFGENPIRFPPKEVLQAQASSPPNGLALKESEINDVTVTSQIKRFLKQKLIMDRSETESGGEESSEGAETPRPLKRVTSGRFPIKVNGSDVPDSRSPALQRPPPIPSRSHYRGLSQQNAALRRPGIMPLTIGNANERVRSNSESLLQRDRAERADKSRRMGVVSKKPSDLTTVEELKTNRYSHLRGLSHGSAIQSGNGSNGNTRSPASPADSTNGRGTYVRRLSSLPERKRKSNSPDPIIEGAKGILFALDQIHPLINSLMGLTRDGSNKRTSLERVFFNATTHVEELDHDIQEYDTYSEEDEEVSPRSNANVRRACITCVSAYIHVCTLLSRNVESLLNNGDPRYIRMLLLHIYGCLVEVRNAGTSLIGPKQKATEQLPPLLEDTNINTIRPTARDKSATPTRERPSLASRMRSASTIQQSNNLRVLTDSRSAYTNGSGRSATMTSATPRSGESFTSVSSAGRMNGDFTEEDRLFERIFLGLQQSSEMAIRTLPTVNAHFVQSNKNSMQQGTYDQLKHYWQALSIKCSFALETAETLKARLSLIKLKEPGIRTQGAFWELCNTFMSAYYNLVVKVKEVKSVTSLIPTDVIALLRPLQKVIRETSQLIQASPWSFLTGPSSGSGPGPAPGQHHHTNHPSTASSYALHSPQVAMPMTPASAALGPAVQATVPSAPQSAGYGTGMFRGDVFERADALLSMGGNSAFSSRAATMTSWAGGGDGATAGGGGTFSPTNGMVRYGGKVVF
ncbi:hypothetical protein VE03_04655 [Pseudogymnoascus sp. 23342-1-I1]|nr:hypothetical protein VE03_04655 [Pseudogymnoascus sp. 23342-1-I1]